MTEENTSHRLIPKIVRWGRRFGAVAASKTGKPDLYIVAYQRGTGKNNNNSTKKGRTNYRNSKLDRPGRNYTANFVSKIAKRI